MVYVGPVTEQTHEQRVQVRHCNPIVFPLAISQSLAVYSEVNHMQRLARGVSVHPSSSPQK